MALGQISARGSPLIAGAVGGPVPSVVFDDSAVPPIPWQGMRAALRLFSGRGQFFSSLAVVGDDSSSDQWTASQVERRANRVLFGSVTGILDRLPGSPAVWVESLPAISYVSRSLEPAPGGRVDWPRTRSYGWPATVFDVRRRRRRTDQLLAETLCWTGGRIERVRADAVRLAPGSDAAVADRVDALTAAAHRVEGSLGLVGPPDRPDRQQLAAVAASGRPWTGLARLARSLVEGEDDLEAIARRLLFPDDDLRWRLFHLAGLGLMLDSLGRGFTVESLRPIGVGSGPVFRAVDPTGIPWDLWFEAAGMWRHYGLVDPYTEASRGVRGAGSPLGADLALVSPGRNVLLVECKYSSDPTYVARDGYHQAVTYLAEACPRLAPRGSAFVMGPETVVTVRGSTAVAGGIVVIGPPLDLVRAVREVVSDPDCVEGERFDG